MNTLEMDYFFMFSFICFTYQPLETPQTKGSRLEGGARHFELAAMHPLVEWAGTTEGSVEFQEVVQAKKESGQRWVDLQGASMKSHAPDTHRLLALC